MKHTPIPTPAVSDNLLEYGFDGIIAALDGKRQPKDIPGAIFALQCCQPELDRLLSQRNALLEALQGLMVHYVGERNSSNVVGEAGIAADKARNAIALAQGGEK